MQRAPSATSPIGPIASTSTSTASLLGNHVISGPTDPRGPVKIPGVRTPRTDTNFTSREVPKTIQYIQKQTTSSLPRQQTTHTLQDNEFPRTPRTGSWISRNKVSCKKGEKHHHRLTAIQHKSGSGHVKGIRYTNVS